MLSDKVCFGITFSGHALNHPLLCARQQARGRECLDLSFKGFHSKGRTGRAGTGKPLQYSLNACKTSGCHLWSSFYVEEFVGIIPHPCNNPLGRSSHDFTKMNSRYLAPCHTASQCLSWNSLAGLPGFEVCVSSPVLCVLHKAAYTEVIRGERWKAQVPWAILESSMTGASFVLSGAVSGGPFFFTSITAGFVLSLLS